MLPRFTSGALGRLTFEHLNEICDTIDRLRPALESGKYPTSPDLVLARVTGYGTDVENFGDHTWTEVEAEDRNQIRDTPQFRDRSGGRTSGTFQDLTTYQPMFLLGLAQSPSSTRPTIPTNTVCVLMRVATQDGKTFWVAIGQTSTATFAAEIVSSSTMGANDTNRFIYEWREVAWSWASKTWQHDAAIHRTSIGQGNGYEAINGCELTTPGIGGGGPGNVTSQAAIRNGTVVAMSQVAQASGLANVQFFFSIPNGLNIVC